ncbi:MAG: hypothetical protein ABSA47_13405 [Verrucomicrobiota bacterium]
MTLAILVSGCGNHAAPASENSSAAPAPPARVARHPATVARNLEWAGATLDNIEKNIADVVQDYKLADTTSLTSAFQSARAKLATLEKAATAAEPDSADLSKAVEFAKNVASVPQPLLDRIGDLDDKRDTFHNLMTDNPSLATTDIAKRFDEALQSLAAALVRLTACQVGQKELDAGEAEGGWNLQALRCDQIIEDGRDEASYIATREDLKKSIREAGKSISLAPLDSAREQVRAAKHRQQEAALAKQKLANQVSQCNLQSQLLDENAGQLDQAGDQAGAAFDQAQQKIQQAIDQEAR